MSQIFDALRRSESERSGTNLAELSVATDLLEVAERGVVHCVTEDEQPTENRQQAEIDHRMEKVPVEQFPQFEFVQPVLPVQSKLVSITAQESLAAEKFRFLAVRLRHLQQKQPLKRLLLTSSMPEEGKSTIAANLACTLAKRQRQKVLLLEGDLRRPTLAQQFGLGKLKGLIELLEEPGPVIKNIYQLEGLALWVMPAGAPSRAPLELMQSGRLSSLMNHLSVWFDWIVIDSPPVLPLGDTSVWMRLADAVLLVTRPGKTAKRQLKRALETIEQPKLLGALLNGSIEASLGDYYHYYGAKTVVPAAAGQK